MTTGEPQGDPRVEWRVVALRDRALDVPLPHVRTAREHSSEHGEGCAERAIGPLGAAREPGCDPSGADRHRERGQGAAPPGEVGALVREARAPERVRGLDLLVGGHADHEPKSPRIGVVVRLG